MGRPADTSERIFDPEQIRDPWEQRVAREDRANSASVCFFCGRKVNIYRPWKAVQYGGMDVIRASHAAYDPALDGDDMGIFEVGPECAKRLPARFVISLAKVE